MFTYCNNNPGVYSDVSGSFPILITTILIGTTITGAVLGATANIRIGQASNKTPLTTKDRIINGFIGAGLGLAAGGVAVILMSGTASLAIHSVSKTIGFLQISGAQGLAIGALAYNVLPIIIAPFLNLKTEPLEFPR